MKNQKMFGIIIYTLVISQNAFAWCSEPNIYSTPPNPPSSFSKPSPPYCLTSYKYTGENSCSQYEIDSYIDDVNNYIVDLTSFAEEAQNFARDANDFANKAVEYANCEAEDVKKEIE